MAENDTFLHQVDQIRREMTPYGVVQLEVDRSAQRVRLSVDNDCDPRHRFETVIEASLENGGTLEIRGPHKIHQPFSRVATDLVALGVSDTSNLTRLADEVRYIASLTPTNAERCR